MTTPLIAFVHGPNLNLLGVREREIYGRDTLEDISRALDAEAKVLGVEVESFQSNHEGELVDYLQSCRERAGAVVLNPAGYTHTSVAIRDAVLILRPIPVIEVHLSVPASREGFRQQNLLEGAVRGRIEGFGSMSYLLALQAASRLLAPRGIGIRDQ